MKRILRFIIPLGVRIAGAAVTVALAVFVARKYGAAYSGKFYYLMSVIAVVGVLTRLGSEQYLAYSLSSHMKGNGARSQAHILFGTLAAVYLMTTLVYLSISVLDVVMPGATSTFLARLPSPLLLAGAILGFNSVWTCSGYLRSLGYASASIFMETGVISLCQLLFFIIRGEWSKNPPELSDIAFLLSILAPVLLGPLLVKYKKEFIDTRSIAAECGVAMKGAVSFSSVVITNSIIVWLPTLVLGYLGKEADAGIYNAAFRVSMLIGSFAVIIKSNIIKNSISSYRSSIKKVMSANEMIKKSIITTLPFLFFSVLISWKGESLVALFGNDFKPMQSIILLLLLTQSINVGGYVLETAAILQGEKRLLNITTVGTLIASITSAWLLIPRYGLEGAAWSFVAVVLVSRIGLGLLWVYNQRTSVAL